MTNSRTFTQSARVTFETFGRLARHPWEAGRTAANLHLSLIRRMTLRTLVQTTTFTRTTRLAQEKLTARLTCQSLGFWCAAPRLRHLGWLRHGTEFRRMRLRRASSAQGTMRVLPDVQRIDSDHGCRICEGRKVQRRLVGNRHTNVVIPIANMFPSVDTHHGQNLALEVQQVTHSFRIEKGRCSDEQGNGIRPLSGIKLARVHQGFTGSRIGTRDHVS